MKQRPAGELSPPHPLEATHTPEALGDLPFEVERSGGRSVQEGAIRPRRELGTAEADVVVPVARVVPVAAGSPDVPGVVVPGTAPEDAVGGRFDRPPGSLNQILPCPSRAGR